MLKVTHSLSWLADGSSPFLSTDLAPDVESINNIEGIFPWGCQWRDVQHEGQANKKFWAKEEYEYWHGDVKQWKAEVPATCTVRGTPAQEGYAPHPRWQLSLHLLTELVMPELPYDQAALAGTVILFGLTHSILSLDLSVSKQPC